MKAGDAVQTPLGKGVLLALGNAGRLVVDVRGRAVSLTASDVSPVEDATRRARRRTPASPPADEAGARKANGRPRDRSGASGERRRTAEVDLHGLTVEAALGRVDDALNDALLADCSELRVVHGRGGGRLRAAVRAHLRYVPTVRAVRLDPCNEGVTIVSL